MVHLVFLWVECVRLEFCCNSYNSYSGVTYTRYAYVCTLISDFSCISLCVINSFVWLFPELFFHSSVIRACPPVTTTRSWRWVNLRTATAVLVPAVRVCTGKMTEGSPNRDDVSMFLACPYMPLQTDTTILFYSSVSCIKPVLNMAGLSLFACKRDPNSKKITSSQLFD